MDKNNPTPTKNQTNSPVPQTMPAIDPKDPNALFNLYGQTSNQLQFLNDRINNLNGVSGVVTLTTGGHTFTFTNGILTKYV